MLLMSNTRGTTFYHLNAFVNDMNSGKHYEDFFVHKLHYNINRIISFDPTKEQLVIEDWESNPVFDRSGEVIDFEDKPIERIIFFKDFLIKTINKAYHTDYKFYYVQKEQLTTDQTSLRSYIQEVDRQLKTVMDDIDRSESLIKYNITGAPLLNMLHKIYNEFTEYFDPNTNPLLQAIPFDLNLPAGVSRKVLVGKLKSAMIEAKLIDRNTSTQQFKSAFSGSDKIFFPSKIKWLPQTHNKQSPNFKALHYLINQLLDNNLLKPFQQHRQTKMLESIFCRPDGSPLNLRRNSKYELKRSPRKEAPKFMRNATLKLIDQLIKELRS
jgi:hypothetical protein